MSASNRPPNWVKPAEVAGLYEGSGGNHPSLTGLPQERLVGLCGRTNPLPPDRNPHRLTDRGGITRISLAALDIGLAVFRWHQLHSLAISRAQ